MLINYDLEPHRDIAFYDMKSFYASVECVERGLNPLTTSLCVMSRTDISKGLILASSPIFKQVFGKNNLSRSYDLPFNIHTRKFNFFRAKQLGLKIRSADVRFIEHWAKKTLIVPPRMAFYIEKNILIQKTLQQFAPQEDIHPYSIDEGFLDLTHSLDFFIHDASLSRAEKLNIMSAKIQHDIWKTTGVYSTIGMSNANPLLAKLALDNEAKKTPTMRANWSYQDVPTKVWGIREMTDFWGIGHRTQKRLAKLKIESIRDIAMANPDQLKEAFGIMGVQLWFHTHGVDESTPRHPYRPKSKGLGNSQVLPRNYCKKEEIELVLSEIAEQVAVRIRRAGKKAGCVSIYVGFSHDEERPSLHANMKIEPTQETNTLIKHVLYLFRKKYKGGAVRNLGVRYSQFIEEHISFISLFEEYDKQIKREQLDKTIDHLREKFGYISLQRASCLTDSSRVVARSKLVGGHAGGMDGMI